MKSMRILVPLVAAAMFATISFLVPNAHAEIKEGWNKCPFAEDRRVDDLKRQLQAKLSTQDFSRLGNLVCGAVNTYEGYKRHRPQIMAVSREHAIRYFCFDRRYEEFCGRTPSTPPTYKDALLRDRMAPSFKGGWAAKCANDQQSGPSCAKAILDAVIEDAKKP
jgi:hypothetical protein